MNTKVEALDNNQVKISFTIEASEVDARIKRTYKDFAKRYKFPGFRPGKAPRPVIDNMIGSEAVRATVTDDLVNEAYPAALNDNDLIALFAPENDFATDMVEEGKDFKFTSTIQVKPVVELSSYDPVAISLPSSEANDEEIDKQVEELRSYYHDFKDAPANAKVKKDDFVEVTTVVTNSNGEAVPSLSAERRLYQLGVNLFPASFDAELIGMKKGESKSFDLDLTNDTSMIASTMGEDKGMHHFEVTVDVVKKKILPEVTDEWAKENFGFESIADMREKIAAGIKEQKEQAVPRRKENECLAELAKRVAVEVPESMAELQESNLLQAFYTQLQNTGMTFDQYLEAMDLTSEKFKEDMKQQASDMVKQDLALDAWARHNKITVTDEEVSAEFEKANLDDPAAVEKEWRASGRIPMIREGILRSKAMLDVAEKAKVTEEKPKKAAGKASTSAKAGTKEPAKAAKKPAAKKTSTTKAGTKTAAKTNTKTKAADNK